MQEMELRDNVNEGEMGRVCGTNGGEEECIHNFGGKPEGKRPFTRPRQRWENINKTDLKEVQYEGTLDPSCNKRMHYTVLEICRKWSLVIMSMTARWAGHVEQMVGKRNAYTILVEGLKGRDHLQDPDRGGRMLIKWISKKYYKRARSTHTVQDKDKWQVLVNLAMNQWVPYR